MINMLLSSCRSAAGRSASGCCQPPCRRLIRPGQ